MRIRVAGLAFENFKLVSCRWQGKTVCRSLVTLQTRHGNMAIGQLEAGLTVSGKRKCAGLKPLYRMAGLAAIPDPGVGKLAGMGILMTVQTGFVLETIKSLVSIGNVAFGTDH